MNPLEMSVDEIISSLKKSSLPTIIVEGSDDLIVYRRFEEKLMEFGVSVLPVGGRTKVLDLFERRMEISTVKMAFLADKDHFVHSGIPDELNNEIMIFTEGYSIENDAYRDGNLSTILSISELVNYNHDIEKISSWYSLAMFRFLAGNESNLSLHPDHVFDAYDDLITLREGEVYPEEFRSEIFTNYERLMRGKTLLALLVKHASYRGREVRHHTKALLEMVAARPGPLISKLFDRVSERFAA